MTGWRPLLAAVIVVAALAIALRVMVGRHDAPVPPPPTRDVAPPQPPPRISSGDASERASDGAAPVATSPRAPSAERAEREELLERLRDSGHGDEPWDAQGESVFAAIGREPAERDVAGCFVAGCGATFTFPSVAAFRQRLGEVEQTDTYRAWTGGKRFTEPEVLPDGRAVVALVLYRPD